MTESYKVPFYILGFLIRLGPLHGYQLKAHIEHEASDFAKIKLPNLYYHLKAMKAKGWVVSEIDREGNRPEREVFSITEDGKLEFRKLLERCPLEPVSWDFPVDGVLFFSKGITAKRIVGRLVEAQTRAADALKYLAVHKEKVLQEVPGTFRAVAELIVSHHELHYQAEERWLRSAIEAFGERGGRG